MACYPQGRRSAPLEQHACCSWLNLVLAQLGFFFGSAATFHVLHDLVQGTESDKTIYDFSRSTIAEKAGNEIVVECSYKTPVDTTDQ